MLLIKLIKCRDNALFAPTSIQYFPSYFIKPTPYKNAENKKLYILMR
jgi:hypothetical protein